MNHDYNKKGSHSARVPILHAICLCFLRKNEIDDSDSFQI